MQCPYCGVVVPAGLAETLQQEIPAAMAMPMICTMCAELGGYAVGGLRKLTAAEITALKGSPIWPAVEALLREAKTDLVRKLLTEKAPTN